MNCPRCKRAGTSVIQTRPHMDTRLRERACNECGYLFITREAECKAADAILRQIKQQESRSARTKRTESASP